jgi:hypothetical protein
MQTPCLHCGALNRPQAKFCTVCGQALAGLAAQPHLAPPTIGLSSANPPRLVMASGQAFSLSTPVVLIGREACDVLITTDGRISRQHARLEQTAVGWQIVDLNSANGTFVNGLRLTGGQQCPLKPGDLIVAGDTTLVFDPPPGLPLPAQPVAPPTPYSPPVTPLQPFVPAAPQVQWRQWPTLPQVEGRVAYIDSAPHMEKKPIAGKLAAAGCLALIAPILIFLPFVTGSDIAVRDMRIEDRSTGQPVAVRIKGDMIGSINTGDVVAVWARLQRGVLEMVQAHNYTTDQPVQVKR